MGCVFVVGACDWDIRIGSRVVGVYDREWHAILGLQYGDFEFWEYWRIRVFALGVGVWSVSIAFDVCNSARVDLGGAEDVAAGVFDVGDYIVCACDGG